MTYVPPISDVQRRQFSKYSRAWFDDATSPDLIYI